MQKLMLDESMVSEVDRTLEAHSINMSMSVSQTSDIMAAGLNALRQSQMQRKSDVQHMGHSEQVKQ